MIEQPFENWLPIPEYENLYEIDTYGNIKSVGKKGCSEDLMYKIEMYYPHLVFYIFTKPRYKVVKND